MIILWKQWSQTILVYECPPPILPSKFYHGDFFMQTCAFSRFCQSDNLKWKPTTSHSIFRAYPTALQSLFRVPGRNSHEFQKPNHSTIHIIQKCTHHLSHITTFWRYSKKNFALSIVNWYLNKFLSMKSARNVDPLYCFFVVAICEWNWRII